MLHIRVSTPTSSTRSSSSSSSCLKFQPNLFLSNSAPRHPKVSPHKERLNQRKSTIPCCPLVCSSFTLLHRSRRIQNSLSSFQKILVDSTSSIHSNKNATSLSLASEPRQAEPITYTSNINLPPSTLLPAALLRPTTTQTQLPTSKPKFRRRKLQRPWRQPNCKGSSLLFPRRRRHSRISCMDEIPLG